MSQLEGYVPVPIAGAAPLTGAQTAELSVYLPTQSGEHPVLYRRAGDGLPNVDLTRLQEHDIPYLLVRGQDIGRCEQVLEAKLEEVLQDADTPPADKAELVHHVGVAVSRELLSGPGEFAGLDRAANVLDNVVSWVLADPEASSYLLGMACHHRSTASHMFVASVLSVLFAGKVLDSDPETLRQVGMAGLLHDLGKLSVDPAILAKPGRLSPEERQHIQQHPIESVRLLDDEPHAKQAVRQMILQHHERVDGRGYPLGLSSEELLPGSKLLAIVDSFHAMIGPRSYREALTPADANRILAAQAGRQFDPAMLAAWQQLFQECLCDHPAVLDTADPATDAAPDPEHERAPAGPRGTLQARRPRLPCEGRLTAVCVYAGRLKDSTAAPDSFTALLHDLSGSGMCIHVPYPMYRGEVINARLRANERTVWLNGVVAWCRPESERHRYRAGIRFIERIGEGQIWQKVPARSISDPHVDPLSGINSAALCSV
jgi:HD-GYP domain-containing protein (c-di-GMP phosphodiesterase class II)